MLFSYGSTPKSEYTSLISPAEVSLPQQNSINFPPHLLMIYIKALKWHLNRMLATSKWHALLLTLIATMESVNQWRWKIVEFRGAEARRHAALPCFSPTSNELFISTNSPVTVLGALRVTSIRFRQIINFYTSFNPTERCTTIEFLWLNNSTNRVIQNDARLTLIL